MNEWIYEYIHVTMFVRDNTHILTYKNTHWHPPSHKFTSSSLYIYIHSFMFHNSLLTSSLHSHFSHLSHSKFSLSLVSHSTHHILSTCLLLSIPPFFVTFHSHIPHHTTISFFTSYSLILSFPLLSNAPSLRTIYPPPSMVYIRLPVSLSLYTTFSQPGAASFSPHVSLIPNVILS